MKHNLTQNLNKLFLCTQMRFGHTPTLQQAKYLGTTETGSQHRFVISESRKKQMHATQDEFITRERNNVMTVQKVLSHLSDDMTTKLVNQTVENGSVKTMWQMLRSPKKEGLAQDVFQSVGEKTDVKLTGVRGFFNRIKIAVEYFFKSKKGTVGDISDTFNKQVSGIQDMSEAKAAKAVEDVIKPAVQEVVDVAPAAVNAIADDVAAQSAKALLKRTNTQDAIGMSFRQADEALKPVMANNNNETLSSIQGRIGKLQESIQDVVNNNGTAERIEALANQSSQLKNHIKKQAKTDELSFAKSELNTAKDHLSLITDYLRSLSKMTGDVVLA